MPAGFRFAFGRAHPAGTMDLIFRKLVQIVVIRTAVEMVHLFCNPLFADHSMYAAFTAFTS